MPSESSAQSAARDTAMSGVFGGAILGPVMRCQTTSLCIALLGIAQYVSVAIGKSLLGCLWFRWTAHRCPACGLSHAGAALLRGDWGASVRYHILGIVGVAGVILLLISGLLPPGPRMALAAVVERWERRLGGAATLLLLLLTSWILRGLSILP